MADGVSAEFVDGDAIGMGGDQYGLTPITQAAEAVDQLQAAETRKPEVGDDQVELQALMLAQGFFGIPG